MSLDFTQDFIDEVKGGSTSAPIENEIEFIDGLTEFYPESGTIVQNITELVIPEGVTTTPIDWDNEDTRFKEYTNLKKIVFPSTIKYIGDYTFNGLPIEEIVIKDGACRYISNAFTSCTHLKSVTLNNGLVWMYDNSFAYCTSLESIVIPDTVTEMSNTFVGCTSLKSVTIGANTQRLDSVFQGCTALKSIELPNSVNYIEWSFTGCTNLNRVSIGDGVTDISTDDFKNCTSLHTVNIGCGIKTIAEDAFATCSNLELITLDVPAGAVEGAPWGAPNARVVWQGLAIETVVKEEVIVEVEKEVGIPMSFTMTGDSTTCLFGDNVESISNLTINTTCATDPSYNPIYCNLLFPQTMTSITGLSFSSPVSCDHMFCDFTNLTTLDMDMTNVSGEFWFDRCNKLENITLRNIRNDFALATDFQYYCEDSDGNEYYRPNPSAIPFTLESLLYICNELIPPDDSMTRYLKLGPRISISDGVYCKITNASDPKLPMVQCESTDSGAMTLTAYVSKKGWMLTDTCDEIQE